jgi:hypothetical protein
MHVTDANINDMVRYFSVGFDPAKLKERVLSARSASPNNWVDLQQIFPNWTSAAINAFPGDGQDDVCHSPAREFFWDKPSGGTSHSRSTEAVEVLLHDFYCPLPEGRLPRFGDYLWSPGRHSARFMLTDPTSGRGISWSIQSGGHKALRLYWLDEDFLDAYAHKPSDSVRDTVMDVWRRCRK